MKDDRYSYYKFDWLGALIMFAGFMFASIAVSVASFSMMIVLDINLQLKPGFLMISNAAIFLAAIAFFDFFVVRPQTKKKLNFNFSPTHLSNYLLIFPMMLGMMFIGEFVTSQIPTTGPFFGEYYDFFVKLMDQLTDDPVVMIITAVIMAPIFEEIIFRGIIQKGLVNKGVKPWKAILIASMVFGLVHANPWQFVGAVMLGCVLGLVYYKTKSLLLPMLLHAFNNLCSSVLIFKTDSESFADAFKVSETTVLAVGIVLFSVFLFLFLKKYKSAEEPLIQKYLINNQDIQMELLVATHNIHKKEEIQQILGEQFAVKSLADYNLHDEIVEDGDTFNANALIKAKYCYEKTGIPSLGDDSGLVVEALDGRPGIFSARYAGDHDFAKNIEKVLSEMNGNVNRKAYFITVLCYFDGKEVTYFDGRVHGNLLTENKGFEGFGYDPVFVPEGYEKTFAEMKPEDKNKISHRKKALDLFLHFLQQKS